MIVLLVVVSGQVQQASCGAEKAWCGAEIRGENRRFVGAKRCGLPVLKTLHLVSDIAREHHSLYDTSVMTSMEYLVGGFSDVGTYALVGVSRRASNDAVPRPELNGAGDGFFRAPVQPWRAL
ncbi:hypothetical protein GCM10007304_20110 [Rhodococcoides trifolii]|uniref:Uncharacterized protein n=1 Tax=Rhodococcoides trifolii TaxID=908250 RepID=A0A917D0P8_9NOCA|nr:hypothetical protein GCM10007304_20110 [Rhodococcus trifolii]